MRGRCRSSDRTSEVCRPGDLLVSSRTPSDAIRAGESPRLGHAEAGHFTLDGTIGQAVAGVVTQSPYVLCSGYWCNVGGEWRLHLPLVLRNG